MSLFLLLLSSHSYPLSLSRMLFRNKKTLQALAEINPEAARILNCIKHKYSQEEFETLIEDVFKGIVNPDNIGTVFYKNDDPDILYNALEHARRENSLLHKGKILINQSSNLVQKISLISSNDPYVATLFYRLRPLYENDTNFEAMLEFVHHSLSIEDLWELYGRLNYNTKKLHRRIDDLQQAHTF